MSSRRRGYLRQYDDLDGALGLAIHDLVATRALTQDDAGAQVRNRAAARLRFLSDADPPDALPETAWYTALLVVEELQGELMEGLGPPHPRMVTWPLCPLHPNHPLWLTVPGRTDPPAEFGAHSAWTCPTTGTPIAELGQL